MSLRWQTEVQNTKSEERLCSQDMVLGNGVTQHEEPEEKNQRCWSQFDMKEPGVGSETL